jgi:hypothetical protein
LLAKNRCDRFVALSPQAGVSGLRQKRRSCDTHITEAKKLLTTPVNSFFERGFANYRTQIASSSLDAINVRLKRR